jgi:amino-acid N-acetyltransferase
VAQVESLVKACAMSVVTHPCYVVRRALAAEQNAICALVRSERLNPHHLHFENFAVAVRGGEVIGASQIRCHRDGSRELGSVVVARPWRGRGISAELIGSLLTVETQTLYVITRLKHAHHYARWGFVAIPPRTAPGPIRRNYRIGSFIGTLMALLQRRPVNRMTVLSRPARQGRAHGVHPREGSGLRPRHAGIDAA